MKIPLYQQIKNEIIETIDSMEPNAAISSERDFTEHFQASRMTIRKAINELVDEGYLYRDANRGTFVSDKRLIKKNSLLTPEFDHYKILYFDVKASCGKEVSESLHIPLDTSVVRFIRVLSYHDVNIAIEEIYIARNQLSDEAFNELPRLRDFNPFLNRGSASFTILPQIVPIKYANILGIKIGSPILVVDSIISKIDGNPLVYIKSFNHPEHRLIEITD
ncbi:GntR family transcriptional regulator [Erysipelothrix tonsillarum]|uniref:GntR family transcriptional regulator n=1 Tax=Erysipelothrix tonsillarum TaxID=38402 RepID=UPI00036AEAF2|nr:GntR family transcriptional regulator [Erysipelothrix tonsillarum]